MIGHPGAVQVPFPSEITPEKIQAGPISYQLSTEEMKNSLQCNGQKIQIPKPIILSQS